MALSTSTSALLRADNIKKHFPVTKGMIISKVTGLVKAVDGVSFDVGQGETFALAGESGCGKTTVARMILRLLAPTDGKIIFDGKDIAKLAVRDLKAYRAALQAVFQDPFSSLDPRMRIGRFIAEPLKVVGRLDAPARHERVVDLLHLVGLPVDAANLYPHEFSGGQRQRIAIARAMAINPRVIVLDEPVSALDVSIRAQIMNLLMALQDATGVAFLLIAHDLAVIRHLSQRLAVMYLGRIVESGTTAEIYARPAHPYTMALLSAALPSHPDAPRRKYVVQGEVPSPLNPPSGCHFHPRCPSAKPRCKDQAPMLRDLGDGHWAACHQEA